VRAWLEITAWWVVLVLVWLATLTTVSVQELVVAGVLAVPCALLARLGRRAVGVDWPIRTVWLRWLVGIPWAVLHDTVAVLRLAVAPDRPEDDRFRELPLPEQDGPGHSAAQEAVATAVLSASPGSVVVDVNDHRLLVHELPVTSTNLDEAVRK
jgi:multisubunit Na+/H+ antiporter MnhE subunit